MHVENLFWSHLSRCDGLLLSAFGPTVFPQWSERMRQFRLSFDLPICNPQHFPLNVANKHEEKSGLLANEINKYQTRLIFCLLIDFPSKRDSSGPLLCDDLASLFDFGGTQLFLCQSLNVTQSAWAPFFPPHISSPSSDLFLLLVGRGHFVHSKRISNKCF